MFGTAAAAIVLASPLPPEVNANSPHNSVAAAATMNSGRRSKPPDVGPPAPRRPPRAEPEPVERASADRAPAARVPERAAVERARLDTDREEPDGADDSERTDASCEPSRLLDERLAVRGSRGFAVLGLGWRSCMECCSGSTVVAQQAVWRLGAAVHPRRGWRGGRGETELDVTRRLGDSIGSRNWVVDNERLVDRAHIESDRLLWRRRHRPFG